MLHPRNIGTFHFYYSRVRISTIAISAIFALVQDRSSSRLKYNVLHVIKFVLVQLLLVQSLL